jgi:hypothetical protein
MNSDLTHSYSGCNIQHLLIQIVLNTAWLVESIKKEGLYLIDAARWISETVKSTVAVKNLLTDIVDSLKLQ